MDRYTDSSGSMFTLGKEIGRGGEGAVYTIPNNPGLVAKIFFNGIDKEKGEKLFALSQLKTQELLEFCAWPVDVLKNSQNKTVGLVMPIVEGHSEIHEFYSPAARKKNLPKADWAFLIHVAINLADAVLTIHKHGHVIGDINQKGILVHPGAGTVKMVDCDSFQVEHNQKRFICKVGVPDFTPPEVRRVGFEKPREANQDNFGLAVLIFQLLFMGRHPFAGRFLGQGDDSLEKAIEGYRFAYGRTSKQKQMLPPPGMDKLAVLDTSILSLFERAFENLGANVLRPSANEWKRELTRLKSDLILCGKSNIHKYPRAHGSCIWCELEKGAGFFFSSMSLRFH